MDADKLDGQHGAYYRAWENLTGIPATASAWPSWDQVGNKPQTFTPTDHSHANYVVKTGDVMTGQLTVPRLAINLSGGAQGAFDAVVSASGRVLMRDYNDGTPVIDFVNTQNNAWVVGRIRTGGNALYLETTQVAVTGTGSFGGSVHADSFGSASGYFISKSNVTILGAEGGASIYLRPNGAFSGAAEAVLNTAGSLLLQPTVSSPGNGVNSFAHLSSGSFGGGFGPIDGGYNIGFWSDNGHLRIGMATYNGTLQQRMGLSTSGALSAVGGFDFGSSRKLKNIIGALPYGLAEVELVTTLLGRYKEQYNPDGRVRLFFDAEQLLDLMPETVDAHGVSFDGELVPAVHIDQLLPVAFNAIKQLSTAVRRLQADLAAPSCSQQRGADGSATDRGYGAMTQNLQRQASSECITDTAHAAVIVSALSHEGLSVQTADGRPARLAVVDQDGRVIAVGQEIAAAAFDAAVKSYRNFLIGNGHLRILSKPVPM